MASVKNKVFKKINKKLLLILLVLLGFSLTFNFNALADDFQLAPGCLNPAGGCDLSKSGCSVALNMVESDDDLETTRSDAATTSA